MIREISEHLQALNRWVEQQSHMPKGPSSQSGEERKQLQAVNRAVDQLRRSGVPVPEDLRSLKLKLSAKDAKELVAYLVIERLYKEMALLPDSPVREGRRTIRTILVIDEAHNYLSQKNIFLQRIIREGRSKGIMVFFASQSPNDYQQKFFNFQELLEFAFIFIGPGGRLGDPLKRGAACGICGGSG